MVDLQREREGWLIKNKDTAELRVVFGPEPSCVPRVDIIAIHDIDETLQKAWVYRKKSKQRASNSRVTYASAGINSYDGEGGLGTADSPAPGRSKTRQPLPRANKAITDDSNTSIEKWLALSSKQAAEEAAVPGHIDEHGTEVTLDDHGPSDPIFAPVEEHDDSTIFGMLASVPEDDDGTTGMQTPDDIFRRRRLRRRPTLPADKRKPGRFATIVEDDRAPSAGEIGDGRRPNADVLSDRQSSLDQGIERRVNWLSDVHMLPSEIHGARVMCYTYKGVEKVASAWQYLTELAEDLVKRTVEKRTPDSADSRYDRVPIVLIGLGFGALILQRAMISAMTSRTEAKPTIDLDMIAGAILLDAPSANPDREQFPRSRSQDTKKTWTQDWLGKGARNASGVPGSSTKIDTFSMWSNFSAISSSKNISILWHYSPMVPTPDKVCGSNLRLQRPAFR